MTPALATWFACGPIFGPDTSYLVPGDTAAGTLDTDISACLVSDSPTLEIGAGEVRFDTWPSGGLSAVSGSQGGQHVFLALRVTGIDLTSRSVAIINTVVSGATQATQGVQVAFDCQADGTAVALGILVPVLATWSDAPTRFEVELTDPLGTVLSIDASTALVI